MKMNSSVVRVALLWFAQCMEEKLDENDTKDDWAFKNTHTKTDRTLVSRTLVEQLRGELKELEAALDNDEPRENVIRECADVANFAMMIADIHGFNLGRE